MSKNKKPPITNTNRQRIKIDKDATIEDLKQLIGKKCRYRVARGESQLVAIEQINFVDNDIIFVLREGGRGGRKYERSYKKISYIQLSELEDVKEVKEEKSKFDKMLDEAEKDANALPEWKKRIIKQQDTADAHADQARRDNEENGLGYW